MPRLHCPTCDVFFEAEGPAIGWKTKCPRCGGALRHVPRAGRTPPKTPQPPPDVTSGTPAQTTPGRNGPHADLLFRLRNLLLPLAVLASFVWIALGLRRVWATGRFSWTNFFTLLGGLLAVWLPPMLLGTGTAADFTKLGAAEKWSNRQSAQLGCWVFLVLAVGCISPLSFVLTYGIGNARLNDYAKAHSDMPVSGKALGSKPRGKILPVDRKKGQVYWWVYSKLSGGARPASLEEIGTVAWLEWDRVKVGEYAPRGVAFRWQCRITVIDTAGGTVIAEQTLWGGEPPKAITGPVGVGSQVADDEIAGYLNRLSGG
jgi:hypothetical protein